jgi:hypothetical protein
MLDTASGVKRNRVKRNQSRSETTHETGVGVKRRTKPEPTPEITEPDDSYYKQYKVQDLLML